MRDRQISNHCAPHALLGTFDARSAQDRRDLDPVGRGDEARVGPQGVQGCRQGFFHCRGIGPLGERRAVHGHEHAREAVARVGDLNVDDGRARCGGIGEQELAQILVAEETSA